MASPQSAAPESPQNGQEWLPVSEAAKRLGISTKTLRKRMARGEVAFRRVALARGGAAFEVEMESGLERSKPMFQTEGNIGRNGSRFGSRNGTLSSVNAGGLEVEMERSISTSKTALEMESEVARLRADLEREREGAAFLRGVIEQLQRDAIELRLIARDALKIAPRQLSAPERNASGNELQQVETLKKSARNAPQRPQNGEAGTYGPDASERAQSGAEREEAPVSYGSIADELERMLNG